MHNIKNTIWYYIFVLLHFFYDIQALSDAVENLCLEYTWFCFHRYVGKINKNRLLDVWMRLFTSAKDTRYSE